MIAVALFASLLVSAPSSKSKSCDARAILAEFDSLYSIKAKDAGDRVAFHKKPAKNAADKITLAVGDQLLVGGPKTDDFRCALFGDASGALITGFLPVANLQKIDRDETSIRADFLPGSWKSEFASAVIEGRSESLVYATFHGKRGAQVLEDEGRVEAKKVAFAEDDDDEGTCRITIERRGPYLVAADNNKCSASVAGIYAKAAK